MIRIMKYTEADSSRIFSRMTPEVDVSGVVRDIIADVAENGDCAVLKYEEQFDKVKLNALEVSREEILEAKNNVAPELYEVIKEAAGNISEFHRHQLGNGFILDKPDGIVMGQRVLPIEKVGIYVPGGTAAYPSTVLMNAIPAGIAGCKEIVMVTPPGKDGKIAPALLAAAEIAGVTRVFKMGGAQAIAALAYGTSSVPRVDKIVGPGNVFVAEAKRQVFGRVAIDMIAGPSEILIVADGNCNPSFVAADLISQAEHDRNASAVLITDSEKLAEQVSDELEKQLSKLEREDIARTSIDVNGKIIITDDLDKAIDIANEIAPEHLELCVEDPFAYLGKVKNAGSVFLGKFCPEALGDYFCGANHTLPTGGTARFSSPLSVEDFVKRMQYTYYTKEAFSKDAEKIGIFAEAEGLKGHGKSALFRVGKDYCTGDGK